MKSKTITIWYGCKNELIKLIKTNNNDGVVYVCKNCGYQVMLQRNNDKLVANGFYMSGQLKLQCSQININNSSDIIISRNRYSKGIRRCCGKIASI